METQKILRKSFVQAKSLSKLSKKNWWSTYTSNGSCFFCQTMVYFDRIKTGFSNKNFDFKKVFVKTLKKRDGNCYK